MKEYLADLERFAVGCSNKAYAVDIVNSMSGGMLVGQYEKHFRNYIFDKRKNMGINGNVKPWNLYTEFEKMMEEIYFLRNLQWSTPFLHTEEEKVLDYFINMEISSSDEVFRMFGGLDDVIERHGKGKERFLLVLGKRKDRCLIVAHADTFFDESYLNEVREHKLGFKEGVYYSEVDNCGIGADDRAGCALLWLLRESGHSILVLDGEEKGQVGANYLKEKHPEILKIINEHSFMIQLDRKGKTDYKCYNLSVTKKFKNFIEKSTGYTFTTGKGKTDICTLCTDVCGVNLSIGYENEHKSSETLDYKAWLNTYQIVKNMLNKPLKRYPLKK